MQPRIHAASAVLLACLLACAAAMAAGTVAERVGAQLDAEGRGPYDTLKDPGRKPVATMAFAGIETGMTVLDMVTGSGYNAEILSAAVGPQGLVYAQNPFLILRLIGGEHHESMLARIEDNRLPNVRYMIVEAEDMPFEASVDMAFWMLNIHDEVNGRGEASALRVLRHIKRALEPGGVLVLSDHVGIPGQDNKALHRIEPDVAVRLIEEAGFEVEARSDLLANPEDEHTRIIYAEGLRYHTDQFLLRARKPQ